MQSVGIDVSKAKLDCCWLRDSQKNKVKCKIFKNQPDEFRHLGDWLVKNTGSQPDEIHVVLEATGVYHEAVALQLYDRGFRVSVVNPARPKKFAESMGYVHKTDKKDSVILAKFGEQAKPALWVPEPRKIRQLKALIARLEALDEDLQRENNRLEAAELTQASEIVIESLTTMLEALEAERKRLLSEIDDHIDNHPDLKKNRALLESIPGVGPVVSRMMLSVIGSRCFSSAKELAAFLGLIPRLRESGTMKGRTMLTKQGPANVRAKLYMAAVVAKSVNPDIRQHYDRLVKNGKTKMQALAAAMRKLTHICFGVLKHQSEYQPQTA
ncbi:IS110 family transposase [Corallincola spongiicola]|uniref:IS110 family transposase n=1 Tax=Corallincola spongiicola TaxID=2520508 RepID=A0ABY1WK91_9GAMM|nr:IS110 family transposase [Corallincola spongiicola]TAA39175.1 IS110 family transposase [Corallincola spongiicola]